MTTTFADYCATADARAAIAAKVEEWCRCSAFLWSTITLMKQFVVRSFSLLTIVLTSLTSGLRKSRTVITTSSTLKLVKYHKIVMETEQQSKSVHAFVDKKTGELYKAASFKAPAKGVRLICD